LRVRHGRLSGSSAWRGPDLSLTFCVGRDFGGEFTVGALYVLKDIKVYETHVNAPCTSRRIRSAGERPVPGDDTVRSRFARRRFRKNW
jgi:hypothetical protein